MEVTAAGVTATADKSGVDLSIQFGVPLVVGALGSYLGCKYAVKHSKNKWLFGIGGFVLASAATYAVGKYVIGDKAEKSSDFAGQSRLQPEIKTYISPNLPKSEAKIINKFFDKVRDILSSKISKDQKIKIATEYATITKKELMMYNMDYDKTQVGVSSASKETGGGCCPCAEITILGITIFKACLKRCCSTTGSGIGQSK